ncbi:phosphatase PAP2 family protein [Streptomyces bungoensis]
MSTSAPARRPLLLGVPALVLAVITWQVVSAGPLLRVDARLSRALVHPDVFSQLLTYLGDFRIAVPVLLLAAGFAARRGRATGADLWWVPPVAALVLMALVPAVVVPLKEWTARPGTPLMPPGTGYFPSGHTATAGVAYGSATLLLLPWLHSAHARRELVVGCAVVTLGVSFGLVRHGYHWPLDVVASWCLCAVLLTALSLVLDRVTRVALERGARRTPPGTAERDSPRQPWRAL